MIGEKTYVNKLKEKNDNNFFEILRKRMQCSCRETECGANTEENTNVY